MRGTDARSLASNVSGFAVIEAGLLRGQGPTELKLVICFSYFKKRLYFWGSKTSRQIRRIGSLTLWLEVRQRLLIELR